MNHLFPVLTALAYLLSFGLYVRFLSTGSKLTGRLGTVLLGLGLIAHYFALLERLRVALSILAYAAFALSFVLSLIFLGEERLLRKHDVGDVVWRLPPLELLAQMSQSSVLVGLVSIAIGTVLGFVWVDRLSSQYSFYDPKYVITLVVLALYALYFRLARTTGWRGARASKLCVFNFMIVVLSFTVVNLYFSHSHRYF